MDFAQILNNINNFYAISVLTIVLILLIKRNLNQHKETGVWNWTRTLLIITWASYMLNIFMIVFYFTGMIHLDIASKSELEFVYITFGTSLFAASGMTFAAYINHKDRLLLAPYTFLFGTLLLFWHTGNTLWYTGFLIFATFAVVGILYQTGYSLRDNNTLGLAIAFTCFMFFNNAIVDNTYLVVPAQIIGWTMCLLISFDKFNVFKVQEV